jgi:hypothetical protein
VRGKCVRSPSWIRHKMSTGYYFSFNTEKIYDCLVIEIVDQYSTRALIMSIHTDTNTLVLQVQVLSLGDFLWMARRKREVVEEEVTASIIRNLSLSLCLTLL